MNAVAASQTFMRPRRARAQHRRRPVIGIGPNPNDPANANLAAVKHYKQIMNELLPVQGTQTLASAIADQNNYAGMAGAWLTTQVLKQSGNPPTRLGLMNALTHLNITNDPYLFKGYKIHTTPTTVSCTRARRSTKWSGGKTGIFRPVSPLTCGLTY